MQDASLTASCRQRRPRFAGRFGVARRGRRGGGTGEEKRGVGKQNCLASPGPASRRNSLNIMVFSSSRRWASLFLVSGARGSKIYSGASFPSPRGGGGVGRSPTTITTTRGTADAAFLLLPLPFDLKLPLAQVGVSDHLGSGSDGRFGIICATPIERERPGDSIHNIFCKSTRLKNLSHCFTDQHCRQRHSAPFTCYRTTNHHPISKDSSKARKEGEENHSMKRWHNIPLEHGAIFEVEHLLLEEFRILDHKEEEKNVKNKEK